MNERGQFDISGDATAPEPSRWGRSFLGTAAMVLGAVIVCLAIVEETSGLPFGMPRSWYVDRPLWYFLSVAAFVVGGGLLRSGRHRPGPFKPRRRGVRFNRVVLYTRNGCHLCDQAKDTLLVYRSYLPEIEEIDIDADPQLAKQFDACVPVVEIDGKVRFRGEVNEILLRRLIENSRPLQETTARSR